MDQGIDRSTILFCHFFVNYQSGKTIPSIISKQSCLITHLNDVSQIENDLFLDENRPHPRRHNITQKKKKKIVGLLEKGKLDVLGILST